MADEHGSGSAAPPSVVPAWSMFPVRRFVVRGRVQGVGFRWWTQREACARDLVGWVRNQRDGSVEIIAGGNSFPLDEFSERLHRGPPAARVESVEVEDVAPGSIPVPMKRAPWLTRASKSAGRIQEMSTPKTAPWSNSNWAWTES